MIVDLFAGPGGWDEGVRSLGMDGALVGVEWDDAACATAHAAGHFRYQADVSGIDPWDFLAQHSEADLDGLIASPPCQGFSFAGKGRGRHDFDLICGAVDSMAKGMKPDEALAYVHNNALDERSALVLEPLRWVLDLEPRWTAWEQVPPVLPLWEAAAAVLRQDGYHVWTGNLHAEAYGVPQTRKRAFLIASRTTEVGKPPQTHSRYYPRDPTRQDEGVPSWVSLGDALGYENTYLRSNYGTGGDPAARGERQSDEPAATVTSKINRFKFMGAGASHTDGQQPREVEQPAHTITGKGTSAWVWTRPSTTVVGSFRPEVIAAPGYRKAGDGPRQNAVGSVRVSVQEAGILQSFPPDYPWQGSKTAQYRQIGDAVPPLLAAHVVKEASR